MVVLTTLIVMVNSNMKGQFSNVCEWRLYQLKAVLVIFPSQLCVINPVMAANNVRFRIFADQKLL